MVTWGLQAGQDVSSEVQPALACSLKSDQMSNEKMGPSSLFRVLKHMGDYTILSTQVCKDDKEPLHQKTKNSILHRTYPYPYPAVFFFSGGKLGVGKACVGISRRSARPEPTFTVLVGDLGKNMAGPMSTIRILRVQSLGVSYPGGTLSHGNVGFPQQGEASETPKSLVVEWGSKKTNSWWSRLNWSFIDGDYNNNYTQIGFKLGL